MPKAVLRLRGTECGAGAGLFGGPTTGFYMGAKGHDDSAI